MAQSSRRCAGIEFIIGCANSNCRLVGRTRARYFLIGLNCHYMNGSLNSNLGYTCLCWVTLTVWKQIKSRFCFWMSTCILGTPLFCWEMFSRFDVDEHLRAESKSDVRFEQRDRPNLLSFLPSKNSFECSQGSVIFEIEFLILVAKKTW